MSRFLLRSPCPRPRGFVVMRRSEQSKKFFVEVFALRSTIAGEISVERGGIELCFVVGGIIYFVTSYLLNRLRPNPIMKT